MLKKLLALILMLYTLPSLAQVQKVENEYQKGQLENGYKVGTWEYYDGDSIANLIIDYTKGKLIHLEPDTSQFYIKPDSVWRYEKLDSHPRYIGSYKEFYKVLGMNMRYPNRARKMKIQAKVYLQFDINANGQATDLQVIGDPKDYFSKDIVSTFGRVPNLWLSASYGGKIVPARFVLPIEYKMQNVANKRKNKGEPIVIPEGKMLSEIVISVASSL